MGGNSVLHGDDFSISLSLQLWFLTFLYFYFKDLFGVIPAKKQQEKPLEEKAKQSEPLKKASSLLFSSDEEVLRSKILLKGVTGLYAGQSIKLWKWEPQSNSAVSTCQAYLNPVTRLQFRKLSDSQIISGSR